MADAFNGIYDGITVEIENLPTDDSRERVLEDLRAEISSGGGPDIILCNPFTIKTKLFPDVSEAMYTGRFADLSEYYNGDADLNSGGLLDTIMDAGVVDGARYVLPLRYEYRVVYADPSRLYDAGLTESDLNGSVMELLQAVTQLGDSVAADGIQFIDAAVHLLNFFPEVLDYQNRGVILDKNQLVDFLQCCQDFHEAFPVHQSAAYASTFEHFCLGGNWLLQEHSMSLSWMSDSLQEAAIAASVGVDLKMFPMRGVDGKLTADIMYYGAVNANCAYPDAAYEFLRMFLLEDAQWDLNINPEEMDEKTRTAFLRNGSGMSGYPVRTDGALSYLYHNQHQYALDYLEMLGQMENEDLELYGDDPGFQERKQLIQDMAVTEEDIPILSTQIDAVRFPIYKLSSELGAIVRSLNDPETGAPTDVDIEALAEEYINFLHAYLHGGTEPE